MKAFFKDLKKLNLFPNLHHITCLVHGLHRVAEEVRSDNKNVDKLISSLKLVLSKSPKRSKLFTHQTGIKLPPKPVITRWGTWLNTCFFYAENFEKIADFVKNLKGNSRFISTAKSMINKNEIQQKLIEICEYKSLTKAITKLENPLLKMKDQLKIIDDLKNELSGTALNKLKRVLNNNTDLISFTSDEKSFDFKLKTAFAPLVTVNVERSFARFKRIQEIRPNITVSNMEKLNIIEYNHNNEYFD
jgi:hypothetical protein